MESVAGDKKKSEQEHKQRNNNSATLNTCHYNTH